MTWIGRLLVAGAVLYAAVCALLFLVQRKMMFPAPPGGQMPSYAPCVLQRVGTAQGKQAVMMVAPAREGLPTVVAFHGNGEDLAHQGDLARGFTQAGWGFVAVEYPGYGLLHEQGPSEQGIYAAAEACLGWLREQGVPSEMTVLYGRSLGTGVATEMARRGHGGRLVLVSPFTSMLDMARRVAPFAPTGLLVRDRFDSIGKAAEISVPTLVLHGDRDEIIPIELGRRLAEALPRAEFRELTGVGHNDIPLFAGAPLMERILSFGAEAQ